MKSQAHVQTLVSEISTLTASTRRISARVMQSTHFVAESADAAGAETVEGVAVLQANLALLEQRTRDLQEALEEATDAAVTDDELAVFRGRIRDAIRKTPLNMLAAAYNLEYFQAQPRSLRSTIAECLIEIFQNKNQTPVDLWQRISSSGGVL